MLLYVTLIFVCQLIGELLVAASGIPVPGPVCGMVLLFVGLAVKGGLPSDLAAVADALLSNLSLLFVPAGVGIILHVGLLKADLVPISVAVVVSTVLTIGVTGALMAWLSRAAHTRDEEVK